MEGDRSIHLRLTLPRQSQVFFLVLLVFALYLTWKIFAGFVIYIVAGIFVAVLAMPLDKFWERMMPNRPAAVMTMVSLFVIIALPFALLALALAQDATELAANVQNGKLEAQVHEGLASPGGQRFLGIVYPQQNETARNETAAMLVGDAKDWIDTKLVEFGSDLLGALPEFFIALTVVLFVVYYVLTDGEKLVSYLERTAPLPPEQTAFLMKEARTGLRAVFVGQIMTSVIQGAIGGVGFLIAQVPGAVVWAGAMAVLSLLPVVGAFLVWIPASLYLLAIGKVWQGIFLLAWGALIVSQVDNFLRPKLIGDRADIHPIFVLLGVLGGVAAFGFIGLFLGPLMVGVTISVLKVWRSDYRDPTIGPYVIDSGPPPPMPPAAPPGPPGDPGPPAAAAPAPPAGLP